MAKNKTAPVPCIVGCKKTPFQRGCSPECLMMKQKLAAKRKKRNSGKGKTSLEAKQKIFIEKVAPPEPFVPEDGDVVVECNILVTEEEVIEFFETGPKGIYEAIGLGMTRKNLDHGNYWVLCYRMSQVTQKLELWKIKSVW